MAKLPGGRRDVSARITQPVVRWLAGTGVTPNTLTWLGFLLAAGAAALVITGHFIAAGIVVLAGGLFDMLDGALARHTGQVSPFGAVLDSVLDRFSEAVLLSAILVVYGLDGHWVGSLLAGVAIACSMPVSYVRAKAETLGLDCKVGLFTRPERVVVLALGLLLGRFEYALLAALAVIAAFSFATVVHRMVYVRRQMAVK